MAVISLRRRNNSTALSADKLNVFLLMAEFGLLGGLTGTF